VFRKRTLVASVAGALLAITPGLPSQSALAEPSAIEVELDPAEGSLKAAVPAEPELIGPTLLELNERSTVLSVDMLMVSVMVEKVEMARTPKGAKKVAKEFAKSKYGWGSYQFSCLETLWTKESNWNYRARNKRTGAHGIPQALPATKMEVISNDWRTNPVTQIQWGLHYIDVRYETPCRALAKFKRSRYY
jgi:hypothetical protein